MSNRGKGFEKCLKDQLSEYPDVLVYRIPDQMSMVKGSCNPSDFIAFKRPHIYFLEMKTIETPSLPAKCISDFQLSSMWEYSKIRGAKCFLIVWYYSKEVCKVFNIKYVYKQLVEKGKKSLSYKDENGIEIPIIKKLKKYCIWDWSVIFKMR
jgi:hypothetical protein